MYGPPAGYVDLQADAAAAPPMLGPYRELTVPDVGVFHAHTPPPPMAIAPLAMAANPKVDHAGRINYLDQFIQNHMQPGEFEDLLLRMITDDVPPDALLRLSRAIATAGTARPYVAVINLALMTGHNWRAIRYRMAEKGIVDPMGLPSMHTVLDAAEALAVESVTSGAETSAEAKRKVNDLYNKLYAPDASAMVRDVNGGKYRPPPPPGFDEQDVEASFDAFVKAAR